MHMQIIRRISLPFGFFSFSKIPSVVWQVCVAERGQPRIYVNRNPLFEEKKELRNCNCANNNLTDLDKAYRSLNSVILLFLSSFYFLKYVQFQFI